MPDEHLEAAAKAAWEKFAAIATRGEHVLPAWEDCPHPDAWREIAAACVEAWDHGGATLAGDFPIDASSIDIVTNEDGSLTVRRKPIAWRPLHEGYGPQPDHS
jgi:hypothetical protein